MDEKRLVVAPAALLASAPVFLYPKPMPEKFIPKTPAELHASAIQRSLAYLDAALKRCETEDLRDSAPLEAALSFLERQATETWPFDQFRKALEDFSTEPVKATARWQVLNASVNGIKRVVRQG